MAARIIPDSIRDVLDYNPETGDLTWKVDRGNGSVKAGTVAGHINRGRYVHIRTGGRTYLAHRLAWFLYHGEQPDVIDHINRKKSDNRLTNLRSVTQSQNLLNTTRTGVIWNKSRGLRYARAHYRQKQLYFGPNIVTAHYRRIMAERADHPIALPPPAVQR